MAGVTCYYAVMATSTPARTALLGFLAGEGRDGAGRTLEEVLAFDDRAIERHHDFIQWLFPLPEPSGANPAAPVLTAAEIAAVRADPGLQAAIKRALQRMSAFYAATSHWLVPDDHNHLRITRIIRSSGLLLGREAAEQFYRLVLARNASTASPVSERSRQFWRTALDGLPSD
ncbi:MAG TPA: opioid growth factor receptor-related protein [Hyphomicrobiaceae bacterium]|nr:opioid growth factor receptor-related protein [Hyphomicrobiaceae bacterium]